MNMVSNLSLIVVGLSVAGVAAALELLQAGASVRVHEHYGGWIEDLYEIGPTPISAGVIPATDFEQIARATLLERGGDFVDLLGSPVEIIDHGDGTGVTLISAFGEPTITSGVIFAPNGDPPEPDPVFEFMRWEGQKVSWSAASFCLLRKEVVVVGAGPYALEQACIAARGAAQVTLLCQENRLFDPRGLGSRLTAAPGRMIRTGAAVRRVIANAGGEATAVEVTQDGGNDVFEFDWMFLADEPEVCWDNWPDLQRRLFPAGMASKVPHWDHEALWNDGLRAAQECLRSLSPA